MRTHAHARTHARTHGRPWLFSWPCEPLLPRPLGAAGGASERWVSASSCHTTQRRDRRGPEGGSAASGSGAAAPARVTESPTNSKLCTYQLNLDHHLRSASSPHFADGNGVARGRFHFKRTRCFPIRLMKLTSLDGI
ncbi:uncharacterized protein AAEQ78_010868 [Lycaon pictus]